MHVCVCECCMRVCVRMLHACVACMCVHVCCITSKLLGLIQPHLNLKDFTCWLNRSKCYKDLELLWIFKQHWLGTQ